MCLLRGLFLSFLSFLDHHQVFPNVDCNIACSLAGLEPLGNEPNATLLGEPGNVVSTSEARLDEELVTQQEVGINALAQAFQVVPSLLDNHVADV